jgi:Fe2+ transport system protein FeoA
MKMEFNSKSSGAGTRRAVPLVELAPGARAVVARVDPNVPLGRRLLDLGFVPGTPIRVLRRAPLGDPVSYELRGMRLCLRRSEACQVWVVPE